MPFVADKTKNRLVSGFVAPSEAIRVDQGVPVAAETNQPAPEMRPVMGRLKEAEQRIQPSSPSIFSLFDRIINAIAPLGESMAYSYPAPGAGAAPLPQTMAQAQGQIKGMEEAGIAGVRYGAPLAAIPFTAGMSLPAAVATYAGSAAFGELAAQGIEAGIGDRPQGLEIKPVAKAAAMGAGGELLMPARAAMQGAGAVRRVLQGARAGAGAGAGGGLVESFEPVKEAVDRGDYVGAAAEAFKNTGIETAQMAALGIAIPAVAEVLGATIRGGLNAGRTVADLFRRTEATPQQIAAARAREAVRLNSGVEVPASISEVIGTGELTRRINDIPGMEQTPETLGQLSELVMFRAARIPRDNRTVDLIAQDVFDVLDPQRRLLQDHSNELVRIFARQANNALRAADADLAFAAERLFPQGVTRREGGEAIRRLENDAMESARSVWDSAYNAARNIPGYRTVDAAGNALPNAVLVDLQPVRDFARRQGLDFVVEPTTGRISIIGAPAGARTAIEAGGNLPNTVGVEEAKQLVSELGSAIRNPGILPGVDVRVKGQLFDVASQQLDNAVSAVPELQRALSDANRIYRENITRFRSRFAESSIAQFGEQGGMAPEQIVDRLLGSNAESAADELDFILGAGRGGTGTAGGNFVAQAEQSLRQTALQRAREAGTSGGSQRINVGRAFETIEKIPQRVRDRLFPNFDEMRDLMRREADLAVAQRALGSRNQNMAQRFIDDMDVDPTAFENALGAAEARNLETQARNFVRQHADELDNIRNLGLNELATRNTFDLVRFIEDPVNVQKMRNLVTMLQPNPQVLYDVRRVFLERLLARARTSPTAPVDPDRLFQLIQTQRGTPGGEGRTAGPLAQSFDALFPIPNRIRDAIEPLSTFRGPEAVGRDTTRSLFGFVLFGTPSGLPVNQQGIPNVRGGLSLLNRIGMVYPELRYRLAAHMLADPQLRQIALQPLGAESARAVYRAARQMTHALTDEYGRDSAMVKEAREFEDSLPQE